MIDSGLFFGYNTFQVAPNFFFKNNKLTSKYTPKK